MNFTRVLLLGAVLALAGCEEEKGAGFTGIGGSTSRNAEAAYSLDFAGSPEAMRAAD